MLTRWMQPTDRPEVEALLDQAIGRGFWDPARDLDGIVLVAAEGETLVGVAAASVEAALQDSDAPPIGHVRLVAVDPSARRRGIGTRLVSAISEACATRGAGELLAYAWVHAPLGVAPLASALARNGYAFERRIEGFYASAGADLCPACAESPCVCPADVYRRVGAAAGRSGVSLRDSAGEGFRIREER